MLSAYKNTAYVLLGGALCKAWQLVFSCFSLCALVKRCFLQFFFYFRLRLAKNVLDDGFAGFWIVTDCVPTLPASILALSDVPFPVCSSFRHGISPFRNEQYRSQEGKATRKRNSYQKVII